MITFLKKHKQTPQAPLETELDLRRSGCRRISFDTKYLGLGKCIDRRKTTRRKSERFDQEAYEEKCRERLGPGWL